MSDHSNIRRTGFPTRRICGTALLLLALLLAGCTSSAQKLDTTYGRTGGSPGQNSVSGTRILAEMFEEAGYDVSTVARLSPRLSKASVIVWAPDDFDPPSQKHRQYLEEWLQQQGGRTVVYIGRDYDAAIDYWRQATPLAPPEQTAEYHRKLAEAISEWNTKREVPGDEYARWFKTNTKLPPRDVTTLAGPWSTGIDPSKCHIKLGTRYEVPADSDRPPGDYQLLPEFAVLLSSEGEPLATRVTSPSWYGSQIIVVPNGSYLLNLPLVNKEHRKLAGRLIDECAIASGDEVVFVESGEDGPPIRKSEANPPPKTGFEMLTVWPLNVLLMHLIGLLLLICIALFPIFGRAKKLYDAGANLAGRMAVMTASLTYPVLAGLLGIFSVRDDDGPGSSGDFGRHLNALGELLSMTGDRAFAEQKLAHYHNHVKRDSGATHVAPAKKPPGAPPASAAAPSSNPFNFT